MLLLFWVRHCKVGVISESRNEQLLKKAIMISSYALSHKKICRWQSSRYHGEICIKKCKKVEKIQIYIWLYSRIVSMILNIQYETSDYLWSMLNYIQLKVISLIPQKFYAFTIYY